MLEDVKKKATERMGKTVDQLKAAYTKLRTGRASAGIIEPLRVDYYGSAVPVSQVASVVVEDARTITITPWEKNMVGPVEKAILASDLGITPNTAGTVIRLILPPLTEERRKDLVKVVKSEAEQAKISIRNVRRDAMQEVKDALKKKLISDDVEKGAEVAIQKLTDQHIGKIDETAAAKEKETMSL
ncbi:MAG TPA: ribosome recycling factor [Verrucomicrobiae bacterium]|nr:ribosome recycling factor [Verrucomicrobiae bacterium]